MVALEFVLTLYWETNLRSVRDLNNNIKVNARTLQGHPCQDGE